MSEVLALVVEALVTLRQKAVNGCLVKLPGCVVNQLRTYCLTSSSEVNRLHLRAFLGDQTWRNRRERCLDYMEGDRELPLEFLRECHDCVGRMRPCIVVE